MDQNDLKFKVTLELDEQWASNRTEDEIVEFIRDKLSNSLGFRARVKRFKVARSKVRDS